MNVDKDIKNVECANENTKRIKTIKNYFESLKNKPTDTGNHASTQDKTVEVDKKDVLEEIASKESVVAKINAFELLMMNGGGTRERTPRKKLKRIGTGSKKKS